VNNYNQNSFGLAPLIIGLVFAVFFLVVYWKVFAKAGKPGWTSIIPFYSTYIILKIAGKPGWWLLLYFIPLVNIVVNIVVSLGVAEAFGRSQMFGVFGLWLFSPIGYSILAFGNSQYVGTKDSGQSQPLNAEQVPPQFSQQTSQQQVPQQQAPQQPPQQASPQTPVS